MFKTQSEQQRALFYIYVKFLQIFPVKDHIIKANKIQLWLHCLERCMIKIPSIKAVNLSGKDSLLDFGFVDDFRRYCSAIL